MEVREIAAADGGLRQMLAGAGLPIDDLEKPGRRFFRFSHGPGKVIGYGGVESAGETALLRSVVVAEGLRGHGYGERIIGWLLAWLAERGVAEAYLLTTTAERLARRCGFAAIDRAQAPPAIRASRQFAVLCPETAVLMMRRLTALGIAAGAGAPPRKVTPRPGAPGPGPAAV